MKNIETAIIIGAGIGGLSTAIALNRVGIKTVIFEQAAELWLEGTGLTLWPNATYALNILGVLDNTCKRQK